jgi:kinetochore protein NNF1
MQHDNTRLDLAPHGSTAHARSDMSPTPPPTTPAPAPPVAETPGPRAQGLINVFNQASKATLDKCSSSNFAACFPTAAQYSPETLEELRSQIVSQLDRAWKTNFEDILARRNVVRLLNELDACIDDAKKRKKRAEEAAKEGESVEAPMP